MVGTIGYLGKVHLRQGIICVTMYTLGACLTSTLVGAGLGTFGYALLQGISLTGVRADYWIMVGLTVVLGLCSVYEFLSPRVRIPERKLQVKRSHWFLHGPKGASFRWGAVLGLGFLTPIVFPLYFAVVALAIATASPVGGAVIMMAFGAAQGLPLLVRMLRLRTGADVLGKLQSGAAMRLSHMVHGVSLLLFASYLMLVVLQTPRLWRG
jgi:cytochrome c biogenesis protein CcdA